MKTTTKKFTALPLAIAMGAVMVLAGCNNRTDTVARENTDATVASADQHTKDLKDRTTQGMDQAKGAVRSAAEQTGNAVSDALITTSVNAELAKDSNLSAVKIDVDTSAGRVVLHGTAPDEISRERATSLAAGVKGVTTVDNQLTVQPRK